MKYILIVLTIIFILALVWWIPKVYQTRKNVQNSKELTLGMDKVEVLHIMGTPDRRRISYFNKSDSLYFYQPPFGASSGIEIIFNSEGKVKQILPYE